MGLNLGRTVVKSSGTYLKSGVDREEEGVLAGDLKHPLPLVLLRQVVEDPGPAFVPKIVQGRSGEIWTILIADSCQSLVE